VLRGGSWLGFAGFCRVSGRGGNPPDNRDTFIGFRLVSPGITREVLEEIPIEPPLPDTTKNNQLHKLNDLENNMIFIHGGTFTMGCTAEQGSDCDDWEKPAHQVTLNSFRMGKYEVTQAEWEAVMGLNPSRFANCPNCPVDNVSWNDVQAFIAKLNSLTGGNYRLPTEAEWEYAARGGNPSSAVKYSGSEDIASVAWYDGNAGNKTHPVGQKQANALGLYDMSGNVWEWCSDWYSDSYYNNSPSTNPRGPSTGANLLLRGGGWGSDAGKCRVSYRNYYMPDYRSGNGGFRLVSPGT